MSDKAIIASKKLSFPLTLTPLTLFPFYPLPLFPLSLQWKIDNEPGPLVHFALNLNLAAVLFDNPGHNCQS